MAMKKEMGGLKNQACMYCGRTDCKCMKTMFFIKGIILILFAYLLLTNRWSLVSVIGWLLVLMGIKYLYVSSKCR